MRSYRVLIAKKFAPWVKSALIACALLLAITIFGAGFNVGTPRRAGGGACEQFVWGNYFRITCLVVNPKRFFVTSDQLGVKVYWTAACVNSRPADSSATVGWNNHGLNSLQVPEAVRAISGGGTCVLLFSSRLNGRPNQPIRVDVLTPTGFVKNHWAPIGQAPLGYQVD